MTVRVLCYEFGCPFSYQWENETIGRGVMPPCRVTRAEGHGPDPNVEMHGILYESHVRRVTILEGSPSSLTSRLQVPFFIHPLDFGDTLQRSS